MMSATETSDSFYLPDEIWQMIFRNIPLLQRLELEFTCRKFRKIMPYDNLGILNSDTVGTADWKMCAYRLCWLLHQKSLSHAPVKCDGIIGSNLVNCEQIWIILTKICPESIRHINSGFQPMKIERVGTYLLAQIAVATFPNLRSLTLTTPGNHDRRLLEHFADCVPFLTELRAVGWCPYTFPKTLRILSLCNTPAPFLAQSLISCASSLCDIFIENVHDFHLVSLPSFPRLSHVTFHQSLFLSSLLTCSRQLETLCITDCKGMERFSTDLVTSGPVPLLKELKFVSLRFVDEVLLNLNAPNVELIELTDCIITEPTLRIIRLRFNSKLRVLKLNGSFNVVDCSETLLKALLQDCTLLEELEMNQIFSELGKEDFASFAYAPLTLRNVRLCIYGLLRSDLGDIFRELLKEVEILGARRNPSNTLNINVRLHFFFFEQTYANNISASDQQELADYGYAVTINVG